MRFINLWNVGGELLILKNITLGLNSLWCVLKVAFHSVMSKTCTN